MPDTARKGHPENDDEDFPNQASLCANCAFGVRQVVTDHSEFPAKKELVFLCHSKAIRAEAAAPATIFVQIHECVAFKADEILIKP